MKNKKVFFLKDIKKIAIIQTAFIGDAALTLAIPEFIKSINPECRINFVTTPQSAEMVQSAEAVDKTIIYDKRGKNRGLDGIKHIASILRNSDVELVLSPHRSLRSTLISKFSKVYKTIGFNTADFSFLHTKKVPYKFHLHEADRNMELLSVFNDINVYEETDDLKIRMNFEFDDKNYIENKLAMAGFIGENKKILIAPGSIWETKKWKEKHFETLIKKFTEDGYKCILAGSKSEKELCKNIGGITGALDISGETTIPQLIYLMSRVNLTVTNDSAPTHLAWLAGCPTATIYGPTSPIFGFYPRGKQTAIIENKNLKCRPCMIHGSGECPLGTHECMKSISPDIVYFESMKIFNNLDSF